MTVFVGKSTAETTQCHSGVKKPVRRADQSLSAGAGPSTPSAVITYNSGKSDKRPPWGGGEERRDSTERYSPPCRNRKLALGKTERSRAGRYRTRGQKAAFAFGDGSGDTYEDRTKATASLRTLSPKSRAYRSTSTCSSLKMARTVTGHRKNKLSH